MPAMFNEPPKQPASTMAASQSASDVVHAVSDEGPVSFMRLPAELRLDIYHYYFSDLSCLKRNNRTVWSKAEAKFLPLLQTSSEVRRETAPIFYNALATRIPTKHTPGCLARVIQRSGCFA